MGRMAVLKSVHVRFSEMVHRTAKMKAAAMGRTLSEYLSWLVVDDKKARDVVTEALAMPITSDDEDLSPVTLKAIEEAEKEPSGGTWEELQAELDGKRKKQRARKN